jgi:hypothetical protein
VDEFDVILRARRVSSRLTANQIGLPLSDYLKAMTALPDGIVLRFDSTLSDDQAGHTVLVAGRRCIIVNGNDRPERQRFTACHELAHIVLGLPTEHENAGSQFARRSPNEVLCDVFAAELLLPCHLFQPLVQDSEFGFAAIEALADDFVASLAATGSRFAAVCDCPCAFVLTHNGTIRYASRSKSLRECGAWIRPNQKVPEASMAAQLIGFAKVDGPIDVSAEEWFEDWKRGGVLQEDARHFPRWNQTLVLLWFDDDRVPSTSSAADDDEEESALRPLDGVPPWPGKSRRRR